MADAQGLQGVVRENGQRLRLTLGVRPTSALDPRRLADHLRVRVATPEDIPTLSAGARRQLVKVDPASWSAVTLGRGGARLVILNSGQSAPRRRSSLAHELAHLILNHTTDEARLSNEGLLFRGTFNREQEDEANWLGGCLLVPRDGLLSATRRTPDEYALATQFGVSTAMIAWRQRTTGVLRQVRRP